LLAGRDDAPPEMQDWLEMAERVITKTGFPVGLNDDDLMKAFVAHNEAVKATIPASQLLVFEVKDGWEPLCEFLGAQVPDEPFPRTNDREEFWDLVSAHAQRRKTL
jgi:Sulfotransferase domain